MAKHLEDIGKDAKDLLNESYPIDGSLKVSAQFKALGLVPKFSLNRSVKREKAAVREIVSAAFEPKYEIKEKNVEFTGKFTSGHDFTGGSSCRDLIVRGSKLELNVTRSDKDGINGVALASFKNEGVAVKGKIAYPFTPKKPIKLFAELVLHHFSSNSNVGVGAEVCLEGDTAHIYGEAVMAHTANDSQYKGLLRYDVYDNSLNCGLSFWQRFNDKTSWAFDILSEDWSAKTTFTAGSEYKATDSCSVKGKWKVSKNNERVDYRFGASVRHKLSPYVTATLGADLNPRSFLGSLDGDANSFGLELKLQD
jgi:hypothetical protein